MIASIHSKLIMEYEQVETMIEFITILISFFNTTWTYISNVLELTKNHKHSIINW